MLLSITKVSLSMDPFIPAASVPVDHVSLGRGVNPWAGSTTCVPSTEASPLAVSFLGHGLRLSTAGFVSRRTRKLRLLRPSPEEPEPLREMFRGDGKTHRHQHGHTTRARADPSVSIVSLGFATTAEYAMLHRGPTCRSCCRRGFKTVIRGRSGSAGRPPRFVERRVKVSGLLLCRGSGLRGVDACVSQRSQRSLRVVVQGWRLPCVAGGRTAKRSAHFFRNVTVQSRRGHVQGWSGG